MIDMNYSSESPAGEFREKLLKGMLDTITLKLIAENPTHGYHIITAIRKHYQIYFGASTIYPLLCNLEKKGYIKSQWNMNGKKPCKIYVITEKGKTMLKYSRIELETFVKPLIQDSRIPLQKVTV